MIRFLNLKNQITEGDSSFAFYDTVTNEIVSFDGEQVFDSLDEFKDCYNRILKDYKPRTLERYISKIPDNFFN